MKPSAEIPSRADQFAHLPKSLAEFEQVSYLVQKMFLPHLNFIRKNHPYLKDNRQPRIVDGIAYDVRKQGRGDEEAFEFYQEGEGKRTTLELRTDKGHNRIQIASIVSGTYNDEGERVEWINTEFKLRRGAYIAQEIGPIPGSPNKHSFQRLVLNDSALIIGKLTWVMEGEERAIIAVAANKETLFDEFMAKAIQRILRFEPVRILE